VDPAVPATASDPYVVEFLDLWNLRDPIYLDYENNGYAADFCHVSAKHMASKHKGRRVHGWALWLYDTIIVGDFHSVWEDEKGILHDVTPPKVGNRILFVRDPTLTITQINDVQVLYNNRTNLKDAPRIWNGNPTEEDCFGIPNDNRHLVAYCNALGLPDALNSEFLISAPA
jgi:hypothetical protein